MKRAPSDQRNGPREQYLEALRRRLELFDAKEAAAPGHTLSLHSLRHTVGVTTARAGLTLLGIRDLHGHSDIGVTQRYAQYAPDNDRSKHQAAAIGKLLAIETLNTPPVPQTPSLKNGPKVSRHRTSASAEEALP